MTQNEDGGSYKICPILRCQTGHFRGAFRDLTFIIGKLRLSVVLLQPTTMTRAFRMKHDIYKAIADETRRKILELLTSGSKNVNGIAEHFHMTRPAISQHLKVLVDAGLVSVHTSGRERSCSSVPTQLAVVRTWIDTLSPTSSETTADQKPPKAKGKKGEQKNVVADIQEGSSTKKKRKKDKKHAKKMKKNKNKERS